MSIFSWLKGSFLHEAVWGGLREGKDAVKETLKSRTAEKVKSRMGGIGSIDEFLACDAAVIARRDGVSIEKIIEIAEVIWSFPVSKRNKITNVIGQGEQLRTTPEAIEVKNSKSIKKPKKEDKKKDAKDGEGEEKSKKDEVKKSDETQYTREYQIYEHTDTRNFRGAELIKLLAEMNKEQMIKFMNGFDLTTTFIDSILEMKNGFMKNETVQALIEKSKEIDLERVVEPLEKANDAMESWVDSRNARPRWKTILWP